MRRIRSKDTFPELSLRAELTKLGIRYRLHSAKLPGRPDLVFGKARVVVFIDGEFWHGHNWRVKRERIKANRDYWITKIEANMKRDRVNRKKLRELGYTVLRFWEKEIKMNAPKCAKKIQRTISKTLDRGPM